MSSTEGTEGAEKIHNEGTKRAETNEGCSESAIKRASMATNAEQSRRALRGVERKRSAKQAPGKIKRVFV
jgi:hypothetical protein